MSKDLKQKKSDYLLELALEEQLEQDEDMKKYPCLLYTSSWNFGGAGVPYDTHYSGKTVGHRRIGGRIIC